MDTGFRRYDGGGWDADTPPAMPAYPCVPGPKRQLTVRLDKDVIDWFRAQGRGYQTRIKAVLRKLLRGAAGAAGVRDVAKLAKGVTRRPRRT